MSQLEPGIPAPSFELPAGIAEMIPPGMDLGSVFKQATRIAELATGGQAKAPKKSRRFVGFGSAVVTLLLGWVLTACAHPLSRAAHSAGNFFTHHPLYAALTVVGGLLQPRFVKILRKVAS